MNHFKKYYSLLTILTIAVSFVLLPKVSFAEYIPGAFVTTWETTSSDESIVIPTKSDLTYSYSVNWGEGESEDLTVYSGNATHRYSTPGVHTISITGTFPSIYVNYYEGKDKLKSVEQWGTTVWQTMQYAFAGASNLVLNATDVPNLSIVDNMAGMFSGATSFNQSIGNWDVSSVRFMNYIFSGASSFNQPIGGWDVSSVLNMSSMFHGASSFNQPIGGWDVSSVENMTQMFTNATSFNQPIGGWDVSSVTNMTSLFLQASSFNQPIGEWNVSNVTDMSQMFAGNTSFNQSIIKWNVTKVKYMTRMFSHASSFNQPIGSWTVSDTINMSYMFYGATSFNQNITNWDVSSVTDMQGMFSDYTNFNNGGEPLTWGEKTSMVANMSNMFSDSYFNQDISSWNVSSVTDMSNMFLRATNFNNGGLPLTWGEKTSMVINMNSMFSQASSFNQDISSWNVSSVTDMSKMFYEASLSVTNYEAVLKSWSLLTLQPNITFDAGNSSYFDPLAITAKQHIIDTYSWTIVDAGEGSYNPKLNYYGNFREDQTNNGSLTGMRSVSFGNNRTKINNTFTNKGGTLTLGTHYNITPKINGLTSVVTISSDGETATLTFTGRAKKHTATDTVNNLTITFYNSAFTTQTIDALNITGKTDSVGKVIFKTNTVIPSTSVLYSTNGAGGYLKTESTHLYTLDQTNGDIIQTIGEMGHGINGIDFHPTTGVLYGNTSNTDKDGSKPKSLFEIDKTTGVATWLGTIKDPEGVAVPFADIAFDSNGVLYGRANYGYDESHSYLFTINYPASGSSCPSNICLATPVSLINLSSSGGSGGALDFDVDDVLYVFDIETGGFFNVNPENGEILRSYSYSNTTEVVDGSILTAAKFDQNDNLFATRVNWGDAPADLIKVNVNTGEITSVGGPKEHMIFMTALAFDVQGTTLYHGQTIADEGVATLSGETQQVMITSATDPVRIVIEDDVTDPKIILTSLISSETKELPQMEITTSIANVYIPAGEITISDLTWDGQMKAPTLATAEIPVENSQFSRAMEVGSPGIKMVFENAVKIVMAGEAGKKLGYFNGGGEFKQITNTCGENSQSWANTNLATEGDCKIDVGTDLVIWTKHFTKFATYTESSSSSGSRVIGYMPKAKTVALNTTEVTVTTTPSTYNLGTTLLKQGLRNTFVKELQRFLNNNLKLKLIEDGIFGPMTKTAVITFQKANNLTPDGIVGPMTKGKMK